MVKLSTIAAIATVTLLRASLKSLRLDPANPPEVWQYITSFLLPIRL